VRSRQDLDEFSQLIAALKVEVPELRRDVAQTVAEAVSGERQTQLSEEVTALKSWVFSQLDSKNSTDFLPIFGDEN
jgi:hypothetical protein